MQPQNLGENNEEKDKAMKNELIQYVEDNFITTQEFPKFKAGDTVNVSYRIVEGSKERIQQFQGVVLQIKGSGVNKTFTVGKDFDIQLNFRYRSSTLTAGSMGWGTGGVGQGRRSPSYRMSLGVKKGFLDNSLVLSLNVRNLLYWIPAIRQTKVESWSGLDEPTGYYSYSIRENNGSQISFNITYKFNNYKNRQQRQNADDYNEGEGGDM